MKKIREWPVGWQEPIRLVVGSSQHAVRACSVNMITISENKVSVQLQGVVEVSSDFQIS